MISLFSQRKYVNLDVLCGKLESWGTPTCPNGIELSKNGLYSEPSLINTQPTAQLFTRLSEILQSGRFLSGGVTTFWNHREATLMSLDRLDSSVDHVWGNVRQIPATDQARLRLKTHIVKVKNWINEVCPIARMSLECRVSDPRPTIDQLQAWHRSLAQHAWKPLPEGFDGLTTRGQRMHAKVANLVRTKLRECIQDQAIGRFCMQSQVLLNLFGVAPSAIDDQDLQSVCLNLLSHKRGVEVRHWMQNPDQAEAIVRFRSWCEQLAAELDAPALEDVIELCFELEEQSALSIAMFTSIFSAVEKICDSEVPIEDLALELDGKADGSLRDQWQHWRMSAKGDQCIQLREQDVQFWLRCYLGGMSLSSFLWQVGIHYRDQAGRHGEESAFRDVALARDRLTAWLGRLDLIERGGGGKICNEQRREIAKGIADFEKMRDQRIQAEKCEVEYLTGHYSTLPAAASDCVVRHGTTDYPIHRTHFEKLAETKPGLLSSLRWNTTGVIDLTNFGTNLMVLNVLYYVYHGKRPQSILSDEILEHIYGQVFIA